MTRRTTHVRWELDFEINNGATDARFKSALAQRRIVGTRCGNCAWVFVPPRPYCDRCAEKADEWVDVSPTGTLESFSVVHVAPGTRPTPFVLGVIRLNGVDGLFVHYLHGDDDLQGVGDAQPAFSVGQRVEAVWREHTTGEILDIDYFRPVPDAI